MNESILEPLDGGLGVRRRVPVPCGAGRRDAAR